MLNHPYSDESKVPGGLSTNEKDLKLPAEVVTMIAETVFNTLKTPSAEERKKTTNHLSTKQEHKQGKEKGKEIASQVSTMLADETSQLGLHVIAGYEQKAYVAKLRGVSGEEIRKQEIRKGKNALEDEDEQAVLEEVVRMLCKRFGIDTAGADVGNGEEHEQGKGGGEQKSGVEGQT